jgi:hypothetical protein
MPSIRAVRRVAVALFLVACSPEPTSVDLIGDWDITGKDAGGNDWAGSTLNFETTNGPDDSKTVTGYFYWRGNGGVYYGREDVQGTMDARGHIVLKGIRLVPPTSGIVTGTTYEVDLVADDRLANGTWGGSNVIPSNSWSATKRPRINGGGGIRGNLVNRIPTAPGR